MRPVDVRLAFRQPLSGRRPLPSALIIGAQKAGTTALHEYLSGHPDLRPGLRKETQFFTRFHDRGERWYRAHFPVTTRATFESTPYYLFHPLAPARARALVPQARLVVVVRDPVDRAWSHYRHTRRAGLEPLSFADALAAEPDRLAGEVDRMHADPAYDSLSHRVHSYAGRGRYAEQIEAWLQHFPSGQLLIVSSDDLRAAPGDTVARVVTFLGLPAWTPETFPPHNVDASAPPVDDTVAASLAVEFAAPNRRLYALVGRDFGWDRDCS